MRDKFELPDSRSDLTTSAWPDAQAYIKGVFPEEDCALTSAALDNNNLTISKWPVIRKICWHIYDLKLMTVDIKVKYHMRVTYLCK